MITSLSVYTSSLKGEGFLETDTSTQKDIPDRKGYCGHFHFHLYLCLYIMPRVVLGF